MTAPDAGLSPAQLANARAIVAAGRARGATDTQIRIALMTALTESSLLNRANLNNPASLALPHESTGTDHASVGVFQQQVGIWGSTPELMNVSTSAGKFFDALKAAGAPDPAAPWKTVQKVQKSAFSDGSNYQANWALAGQILAGVGGSGPTAAPAGLLDGAAGAAATVAGWAAPAVKIGQTLSSPAFWQRAGVFSLGALLLFIVAWKIFDVPALVAKGAKLAETAAVL